MSWFERNIPASVKQFAFSIHPLLSRHLRTIMAVEGYLARDEAKLLFELASRVTDRCILEVGSYRGKSTVALALGSQAGSNVPVYAIEPHENHVGISGKRFGSADRIAFFKNLLRANCAEVVRLLNVSSEMVSGTWVEPIGLLWIDGDHRYAAVKRDFECWEPFVAKGGLILFHDSIDKTGGPALVIQEALSSGCYREVDRVCLTTVLQKNGR